MDIDSIPIRGRARKKPVVIDFERFTGTGKDDNWPAGILYNVDSPTGYSMHTLENTEILHEVRLGDVIITGVKGERYPCRPDIFVETYELE